MHYDFKRKLNKGDSQQNRNLLIPEIDWILNEAQELFVKMIAQPRVNNHLGFERTQRTIDDIRNVVIDDEELDVVNNIVTLPPEYWHYVTSYCLIKKEDCEVKSHKTHIRKHRKDFENSFFDKSSFEWRVVNGVFNSEGIRLFSDTDFTVTKLCITYIKKLKYIHNAQEFRGNKYKLPSGLELSGHENCELPETTHREIVDIAVLIATGELQIPDYNIKRDKLNLNQIN